MTIAKPVRDLSIKYSEIVKLVNAGYQIMLTNNGREETVLIGVEDFKAFEAFTHRRYINNELAKAKKIANDPNAMWLSDEEVDAMLNAGLVKV